METINIYGDNRFEKYTKIREACWGHCDKGRKDSPVL